MGRMMARLKPAAAGEATSLIDPTSILDGWRLLESTAVYRSTGHSAFRADGAGPERRETLQGTMKSHQISRC